jgi:AcrR family transcriptional regulator
MYSCAVTMSVEKLGTKGTRTRAALLEHAVRRFARDGFRGTSVAEVSRDAGLTPAAAYAYFENKEALFDAAVDLDAAGLVAEAIPGLAEGRYTAEWTTLVAMLLEALDRHPLVRRVLAGLEPARTELLLDIPALVELRAAIAAQLHAGQRSGVVRPDIDPAVIASGLETVIMSILIAVLQTGVTPQGERADGVVALLEAAVRPVPAAPVATL